MKFSQGLGVILGTATLALIQWQPIQALTAQQVGEVAKQITVMIGGLDGKGSGVIIARQGNTYTVLTAYHVIKNPGGYDVITIDGQKYPVESSQQIGELDLALIKFTSSQTYTVANIANSNTVQEGATVYYSGYPVPSASNSQERIYRFLTAQMTGRGKAEKEGYDLFLSGEPKPGISGGPILDEQGRLIGIYGKAEDDVTTEGVQGIPIEKVPNLDRIATATPPNNRNTSPSPAQQRPLLEREDAKQVVLNGPEVSARLGRGDKVLPVDNSFYHVYAFDGKAGQQVTIEMASQEVDAYLILLTEDGSELAQDDDSGGAKNAKIVITLPSDGTYIVLANSYEAGQSGNYRLRLAASTPTNQPPAQRMGGMILNEKGSLDEQDSVLSSDGSFYDEYTFEGRAGQSVTILLESSDFDPYLAVFTPDGKLFKEHDDISQSNSNSQITLTLPVAGIYRVIVNGYDDKAKGRYSLTVRSQ